MRVIIAGSRTINDYSILENAMEKAKKGGYIDEEFEVITGGAVGIDLLGKRYAEKHNLKYTEIKPKYKGSNDRSAPLRRNQEMADIGDVLIAIWDGESHGTKHMINCAREKGLKILIEEIHFN